MMTFKPDHPEPDHPRHDPPKPEPPRIDPPKPEPPKPNLPKHEVVKEAVKEEVKKEVVRVKTREELLAEKAEIKREPTTKTEFLLAANVILKAYGGIESDIPVPHNYWVYLNKFRSM